MAVGKPLAGCGGARDLIIMRLRCQSLPAVMQASGGGLDEAAAVLKKPGMRKVARSYLDLHDQWRDLAETALPSKVPAYKKVKALLRKRHDLFQEKGTKGFLQIAKINADMAKLGAPLRKESPVGRDEVAYPDSGLRKRVEEIHVAEVASLDALERTALR